MLVKALSLARGDPGAIAAQHGLAHAVDVKHHRGDVVGLLFASSARACYQFAYHRGRDAVGGDKPLRRNRRLGVSPSTLYR
jgi:hypothetical protein